MKKLFLAICFIVLSLPAFARTVEVKDMDTVAQQPQPIALPTPGGLPDPSNTKEVINFLRERFKNASVSNSEIVGNLNQSNSINVQHSAEYIAQMQENKKSTFEKIYDEAMGRISGTNQNDMASSDTVFYEEARQHPQNAAAELQLPNIPVVNVTLPTGKKIIAPAREHIPYMLASFKILPTGLIQVEEDFSVVANGEKLKHGITKIIPKYTTSRANVRKKLDIQLLSVTINGHEIPYHLEEIGDKIYIKPQQEYELQPGIYNFSFKYLLDRKLWYYDDFTEFYWDVTGSYLNLVITSANAIVSIPDGKNFLTQNVMTGYPRRLSNQRAIIASLDNNALGFAATTPVLPGEGMHLLVSLDKNVFMAPGFDRRLVWFITDYGDVLFALAGLAAILGSYILSWNYIKRNKTKLRVAFKQSAPIARLILKGRFDKTTLIAAILELYRKNVIDIQKRDNIIMLIKRTDNLACLSRYEKKAVEELFPGKESVITAAPQNQLKFNRAATLLEKGIKTQLKMLSLQFSIGYLLFSIGMLILTTVAIAMLGINPMQTGLLLFSSMVTIAFYIWIIRRQYKSKVFSYVIKTFAAILILFAVLLMSVYIKLISAVLLAAMIYTIFEYSILFSRRNGVIKGKIKELEELKKYLEKNAQTIGKAYEFSIQQANIFALDLADLYPINEGNKSFYKLDAATELARIL